MWPEPELHVRGVFKSKVNCFMFAQQRQDQFSLGYFFMLSGIFQSLLLDKSRKGFNILDRQERKSEIQKFRMGMGSRCNRKCRHDGERNVKKSEIFADAYKLLNLFRWHFCKNVEFSAFCLWSLFKYKRVARWYFLLKSAPSISNPSLLPVSKWNLMGRGIIQMKLLTELCVFIDAPAQKRHGSSESQESRYLLSIFRDALVEMRRTGRVSTRLVASIVPLVFPLHLNMHVNYGSRRI